MCRSGCDSVGKKKLHYQSVKCSKTKLSYMLQGCQKGADKNTFELNPYLTLASVPGGTQENHLGLSFQGVL